jgi:hypothetical protein
LCKSVPDDVDHVRELAAFSLGEIFEARVHGSRIA